MSCKQPDHSKNVEIRDYERDALFSLATISRTLASTLHKDDPIYAQQLMVWVQMVEGVLDRMEVSRAEELVEVNDGA